MSEQLRTVATTQSTPVPATRTERRQMRRAGVSLQVRIRTADFNDGTFEEVKMTQNASRKALYFITQLDRYYKGMRVRVTSPYDPGAGAANLEQVGEVARVHRRADGYGVAVAILSGLQSTNTQSGNSSAVGQPANPQAAASTAANDRRCATRSSFIAPVEMVEMRTGSRIYARTSDLSPQGCYIDTLNPLPVGAAVRLQIQRAGLVLDVLANVSSRHVGSGMGLVFGEIAGAQRAILESWLSELGLPPRAVFEKPFPAENPTLSLGNDCATRLVQVLLRKGALSQSEAREILSGCFHVIERL
jgi:FlaG/FlaF family flagellin (archaellin)